MIAPSAAQPGTPGQQNLQSLDDFYVPGFRVLINRSSLHPYQQFIHSITFHDSLTEVDSVDLVVDNWDPGVPVAGRAMQGEFRFSNSHVFDPWQEIQVFMGYYRNGKDNLKPMLLGEISSMSPTFPASGPSTLTVRALSLLHRFRTKQKTKPFHNLTDTGIAKQIVDDINADLKKQLPQIRLQLVDAEVQKNKQKEKLHTYLEMHNQYPIVFLLQRSRDLSYDLSTEDEVDPKTGNRTVWVHYRSSGDVPRPTYVLEWGKSLISFQPTLQTARQVNSVTVTGWNVQTKKAITKTVTRADLVAKDKTLVMPSDLGVTENALSQKEEVIVDRSFKDENEAKDVALDHLRRIAQGLVEAKGKTVGLPELRAGGKINIHMYPSGQNPTADDRFSGTYAVTSTTHTINESGYTTEFTCRMEARLKG
jgi:uncharacterized protein